MMSGYTWVYISITQTAAEGRSLGKKIPLEVNALNSNKPDVYPHKGRDLFYARQNR